MSEANNTWADLLELDLDRPASKEPAPIKAPAYERPLDLVDGRNAPCLDCKGQVPVNENGLCKGCATDVAPAADFATIAAESKANANVTGIGSLNGGELAYVGFTSAEGYVTALANGVKAATAAQYKSVLANTYGYTPTQIDALPVTLIDEAPKPESKNPIVHQGDTDAAVAKIKAHSAALKQAQARAKANDHDGLTIVPTTDAPVVRSLRHGDLVAGAVAEGNGILTHWAGADTLTRGEIVALLAAANLPTTWAPKARDAKTQANLAVTKAAAEAGLVVVREKRSWRDAEAAYDARWRLIDPTTAGNYTGDSAGSIVLVVTLNEGALEFDHESEVSVAVRTHFDELTAKEVLQAGHVTNWLGNQVIRDRLGGVRYGGSWYVPVETRATAEALINAFAPKWGSDWMNPPLPIATSAQLAKGIANGLAAEVDDTLRELAKDGSRCVNGKVGEKGAIGYLRRFRDHAARALAFEHLLGSELVKECKAKIAKATEELDGLISDGLGTAKRFELIWEELERDLRKESEKKAATN